ncbi:MAG: WG repeat-containing protein, partial [Bacteroidales bacterium]|nr:WG repeat-containing protein [Bacteroidales bacterium]
MKAHLKALLSVAAVALCIVASAQDLKPAKDKKTKKYGYKDKQKNWVIEPSFDDAKKFDEDGCALVKLDGLYGLIDLEGNWVLPAEYDDISKYDKHGLCEIRIKEGKTKLYGVADRSGNVVLPTAYRKVEIPKNGSCILASAYVDEPGLEGSPVWGVYSLEGKEVFPPQFLYSPSVYDDKLIVKDARTSLYGLVDVAGNVLLPINYLAIEHGYNCFKTLDRSFIQANYTEDVRRAETLAHPGAVLAYDPMNDRVRAAAWHVGCVTRRLYSNQVRNIEIQPGSIVSSALCTETGIDWGVTGRRFIRLEPVVTDTVDVFAMADPTSDKYYTLKALLYEQDGTLVGEVSGKGFLEAQCAEGTIYMAEGGQRWIILNDPNNLALPAFSMMLAGYRTINHDNVCNGL